MDEWISVKERMPKVGQRVRICYQCKAWDYPKSKKIYQVITIAQYQDGSTLEDDFSLAGDTEWLRDAMAEFCEEKDQYYIPAGWYEGLTSLNAEYFTWLNESEIVTHWKPMDEFPEKVECEESA